MANRLKLRLYRWMRGKAPLAGRVQALYLTCSAPDGTVMGEWLIDTEPHWEGIVSIDMPMKFGGDGLIHVEKGKRVPHG